MPVEIRYYRSDNHTINVLTARKLLLVRSGVLGYLYATGTPNTVIWTSDVYVRSSGGTEVQIGSNVAQVSRSTTSAGIQSNTFNAPETELLTTDAIRVIEKMTNTILQTLASASFITEQLGAATLTAAVWTIYRYTFNDIDPGEGNMATLQFDTPTQNTRIENFTWNLPSSQANNLFFCNG